MQTQQRAAGLHYFQVVLFFKPGHLMFSTFAEGGVMEEALKRAEEEFSLHSERHKLGNKETDAALACVIGGGDNHRFTKRDGRWQLVH